VPEKGTDGEKGFLQRNKSFFWCAQSVFFTKEYNKAQNFLHFNAKYFALLSLFGARSTASFFDGPLPLFNNDFSHFFIKNAP